MGEYDETLRFEGLEIPTAYAVYDAVGKAWTVTLEVRNTETVDVTLTDVLMNGRTFSTYMGQVKVSPVWLTFSVSQIP